MQTTSNDAGQIVQGYEKIIKRMEKSGVSRYLDGFYSGIVCGAVFGVGAVLAIVAAVEYFIL